MEGIDGFGIGHDYADADLIALRRQEEELQRNKDEDRARLNRESEKELRRKNIKALGGKPVA